MEIFLYMDNQRVLITTAAERHECQAWAWWDAANVIVQIDSRGARVLKGELRG